MEPTLPKYIQSVKANLNFDSVELRFHSFRMYAKNISYPLIRTGTCAYQGVKKFSFLENLAYLLIEYFLKRASIRKGGS